MLSLVCWVSISGLQPYFHGLISDRWDNREAYHIMSNEIYTYKLKNIIYKKYKFPFAFSKAKAALNISSIKIAPLFLQYETQVLSKFHKTQAAPSPQKARNFRSWQGFVGSPKNLSMEDSHTRM